MSRVLVTGAARRIGRMIALELGRHGWDVIVHYHTAKTDAEDLAQEIAAMGRKSMAVAADFSKRNEVEKLIPSLRDFGELAALVNNAALFEPDERDPGGTRHFAINAEAPRLLTEAFRDQMTRKRGGTIVNMLDGCMPETGFNAYKESKLALERLTQEMALNFAPQICVNGVAPGPSLRGTRQSEAHFDKLVAATPLRIAVPPQAIASTVRFLSETPAITGEIVRIDSGEHLMG